MSVRVDCSPYNVANIPTHLLLTNFSPLLSPLTAGGQGQGLEVDRVRGRGGAIDLEQVVGLGLEGDRGQEVQIMLL